MPRFTTRSGSKKGKYQLDPANVRELTGFAKYLETRHDHVTRFNLHRLDERILRCEKYTLEELRTQNNTDPSMWPSVTSNGPRTYWNAVRRATTSNSARVRVRLPGFPGPEVDVDLYEHMLTETARHEHFAYGALEAVDEQRLRRGDRPVQDNLAFYLGIRGGVFMRPWYKKDARTPFDLAVWDPKTVVYEPGSEMLDFVCHHYKTTFYDAVDRYYEKFEDAKGYKDAHTAAKRLLGADDSGNVEIYDIWWCEYDGKGDPHIWSAVIGSGDYVLQDATEWRDLDTNPVFLVRSFGPDVELEADYNDIRRGTTDRWETIYTANRDIYPWINRILTLYGLYLRNGAIGPWHANQTGMTQEQLMNANRPFNMIQTDRAGATIQPLGNAQMAPEVKEFLNWMSNAEQRGGVPFSVFGQIPFEISGFAVNQLQGAVGIVAEPMAKAMGWCYRMAVDSWIQQFRARGGSVSVYGKDTRQKQFLEEISRAQLRDKYSLDVEISPELPVDKLQQANIAVAWKNAGIDPITIADQVFKVDDPRELAKRIVVWEQMVAEIQAEAQPQQAALPPGMNPEVLPPELNGMTQQHNQFQRSAQQTSDEELAAAGMAR
jgi:hypothetical protein